MPNSKFLIAGVLVCFAILYCQGQSTDLLRLEYTKIPNDASDVVTSRYRVLFNLPFKIKGEEYFILGSEYNYINFKPEREYPFEDRELERLHIIDLNLGYMFKWNEAWRLVGILTPRLASNLVGGTSGRDFLINATAAFWKERMHLDRPFRLVLGLTYNSTTGLPVPLPLINYHLRFHPNWSFTLGIPRSDLRFYLAKRNTFLMALFLDGYFVNVQNDIILPDNNIGAAVSLSALIGGFGYQFNISKMASFYGFAGYTFLQNGILRNNNRNNVFTLNDQGSLYYKLGFKVSIF